MTIIPMQRPPIRQSTVVRSTVEHTFEVFVDRFDQWWPLRTHSLGEERVVGVTIERRAGGRVYEIWDDGQTRIWGTLLAWTQRLASSQLVTHDHVSSGEIAAAFEVTARRSVSS